MPQRSRRRGKRSKEPVCLTIGLQELLALIGRGSKLDILLILSAGPHDVTTIAEELGHGVTLISNHLCAMTKIGLLEAEWIKCKHVYRISSIVTVYVNETGEYLYLATPDGGWTVLHVPLKRTTTPTRTLTVVELKQLVGMVEQAQNEPRSSTTN